MLHLLLVLSSLTLSAVLPLSCKNGIWFGEQAGDVRVCSTRFRVVQFAVAHLTPRRRYVMLHDPFHTFRESTALQPFSAASRVDRRKARSATDELVIPCPSACRIVRV
jgi:hypothetical protein